MGEIRVSHGGESKQREDIAASHTEVPLKVYRTDGFPTIFAGLQVNWIDGSDPKTDATFNLNAGAGVGSQYMTLTVKVPGHDTVYEYVDITEFLNARVAAILKELTDGDPR